MKVEDIYAKLFEFEFCEPTEKIVREQEFNDILKKACQETKRPLYVLKPAILKRYPAYRARRLAQELPNIPPLVRDQ